MATPDNMIHIQAQVRQNQHELSEYIKHLDDWESTIKKKDQQLLKDGESSNSQDSFPPVRNSLQKKKKLKKTAPPRKPERISGQDFAAWDKFDVDAALKEVDGSGDDVSESTEYETDEEWEVERRKQQALMEKERGNTLFKKGEYDSAVECYTLAMDCDPTNPVLPANRAMALLKQHKYAAAEADCTLSISLDPLYIKAYLRRGSARLALHHTQEALDDYLRVVQLEPGDQLASTQIKHIHTLLANVPPQPDEASMPAQVHPIYKPPELRSKKPLYRVDIEEIGVEALATKSSISKRVEHQSTTKQTLTEKDARHFDDLMSSKASSAQQNTRESTTPPVETPTKPSASKLISEISSEESVSLDLTNIGETRENRSTILTSPRQHTEDDSSPRQRENVSPRLPPGAQTSLQFQCDWRKLHPHPLMLYDYMKQIQPSEFSRLIGQFLEEPMLMSVMNVLLQFYIKEGVNVYPVLEGLSQVKRFSMVMMFLDTRHKNTIRELFTAAKCSPHHDPHVHSRLSAAYNIPCDPH